MRIDQIFDLGTRYSDTGDVISGGSGDVYICIDNHLERKVAIKVIRDPDDRRRVDDEIRSIMALRSKHVVQAFDVLIGLNNTIGLVLEFIDGEELSPNGAQGFSAPHLMKLLWQISSGVSDVHDAGFVHRDLKPNNIILDQEGIVKIIDFGLSRSTADGANTLGFKGSIGYAAPELFRDGIVYFNEAIDVYAFGAIALELASGKLPEQLRKIPPDTLSQNEFSQTILGPYDDLCELLRLALAYDPTSRPRMNEIRDLLAGYLTKDRHQGLAVVSNEHHLIDTNSSAISIKSKGLGRFTIRYDGIRFTVERLEGNIFVNSSEITAVTQLPGASVIAMGDESLGASRVYVTFDISWPEIEL